MKCLYSNEKRKTEEIRAEERRKDKARDEMFIFKEKRVEKKLTEVRREEMKWI